MKKNDLYAKFTKDYPQTGNKEGEVIKLMNKIPPHLAPYVKESSKTAFDDAQKKTSEGSSDADRIRETGNLKDQVQKIKETEDPSKNTGNALGVVNAERPDANRPAVTDSYNLEINQELNRNMNPPNISRELPESNAITAEGKHSKKTGEAVKGSKK